MDLKSTICSVADSVGAFPIGSAVLRVAHGTDYIRAVNYHGTPRSTADGLRRQLGFYRQHFENVSPQELAACLAGRRRAAGRPGLILSFDDGEQSNFEVAAPLLEEFGFTGWFFVSSGRVGGRDANRPDGLAENRRAFMTFEEMRDLRARGHVIGCHTHSHVRLGQGLGQERLRDEIVESRRRLEKELGFEVDTFCWVGGEEWSYSVEGARLVAEAGYRFAFTTNLAVLRSGTPALLLDRTNIEADWPMAQVRFYLSGAMDLAYAAKRRRVAAKLRQGVSLAA